MRDETEGQLLDGKQDGSFFISLVGRLKVSSLKVAWKFYDREANEAQLMDGSETESYSIDAK